MVVHKERKITSAALWKAFGNTIVAEMITTW
jgi:hypothetical protein